MIEHTHPGEAHIGTATCLGCLQRWWQGGGERQATEANQEARSEACGASFNCAYLQWETSIHAPGSLRSTENGGWISADVSTSQWRSAAPHYDQTWWCGKRQLLLSELAVQWEYGETTHLFPVIEQIHGS